jgi:hypothetical protein
VKNWGNCGHGFIVFIYYEVTFTKQGLSIMLGLVKDSGTTDPWPRSQGQIYGPQSDARCCGKVSLNKTGNMHRIPLIMYCDIIDNHLGQEPSILNPISQIMQGRRQYILTPSH